MYWYCYVVAVRILRVILFIVYLLFGFILTLALLSSVILVRNLKTKTVELLELRIGL